MFIKRGIWSIFLQICISLSMSVDWQVGEMCINPSGTESDISGWLVAGHALNQPILVPGQLIGASLIIISTVM